MEKLYVLAGKARSGKDSVALEIAKYYGDKKIIKYSCTVYLKDYIKKIYNWDGSDETKPRDILQNLGKCIKVKYPSFFLDRMREDIAYFKENCDILIITGIRLVNELEFLSELGAILIKVNRDCDNGLTEKQQNDITETDVDNYDGYDYVIDNYGNFDNLKKSVKNMLEEVER